MRYSLAQIRAVMRGDMASFFGDSPHPAASARAKAAEARPAAKASAPPKRKGFWDFVAELMGSGKSKSQAVASAAREHPDLHRQMLTEFNVKARADAQRDREKAADARAALRR